MTHADLPLCQFIATGGTIAMRVDPILRAPVPALSAADLLASVPGFQEIARLSVHNLCNVPSDYMGPERWIELQQAVVAALQRDDIAGVVISHGTDTIEETAWFLDLTVASEKPVVLVGAQRNASEPDFDGPRNLRNGVRVCVCAEARAKGVLVVLNNQINAARDVSKTHTSNVEAFMSGYFGFLGTVDDDRVVFARAPLRRQFLALTQQPLPCIEIISMHGGASGGLLRAAIREGAKGIVVQALGWGNVNADLFDAITEAIGSGVVVVISTRVHHGRVRPVYGFVGGGKTLKEAGAVFADDLSPQKARILLMIALQAAKTSSEIQGLFDQ